MTRHHLLTTLRRLARDRRGNVAIIFGLALLPMTFLGGAVVDYTRASTEKARLQDALDRALLAGAADGTGAWKTVAQAAYRASAPGDLGTPVFERPSQDIYAGTVTHGVPAAFSGVLGVTSIPVSARSQASADGGSDTSCVLALGGGMSASDDGITFNGAPKVDMSGCTLRSNVSMRCNGHGTGAAASIAAGTSSGCSNPRSSAPKVRDVHAGLASHITKSCTSSSGVTWSPGTLPTGSSFKAVTASTHTEYHVCGTLTLSGSGWLTGETPTGDTVIVIENGDLVLAGNAEIRTSRVTFVLTGDNTKASRITFPNGKGKAASLTLSPSTNQDNPWRGVSLYQDPALTKDVAQDWGPGTILNADGVVYLPNADVRIHGSPSSNNPLCAKFVLRSLTSNGAVNLKQSPAGCAALGVKQAPSQPRLSV